MINEEPALFWGLIVSMWVGNGLLLLLNLPLIGLWVRLLRVPYRVLFPAIVAFACIGTLDQRQRLRRLRDPVLRLLGYGLVKAASRRLLLLGFVLGPLLENHMRAR